ncbi:MAG: oxidoreductase-like domain-containing protein [Burkholderiaceae bacterium]
MPSSRSRRQPAAPPSDPAAEPPQAPVPPALEDCCGSGCNPCIFDVYEDALERYRQRLAAWQQRQAMARPRSKDR